MEFFLPMTPMDDPAIKDTVLYSFLTKNIGDDSFKVYQLAGDASARRYYRIISGSNTWVLMEWEPFKDDGSYPFLSVQNLFKKQSIHVPEVIKVAPDDGIILLEDLGDLTLERKFWDHLSQELSYPFYQLAIDELIKIHYGTTKEKNKKCTAFNVSFDTAKFMWELNYGLKHLLGLCDIKISSSVEKGINDIFTDICTTLDNEPKFICHRDYHSRNLMIHLGKVCVIDFQDARLGPIQYDLVSLIKDSYVELDKELGKDLIDYYLERRSALGLGKISWDDFSDKYELQSVQRCFKACGSFASFYNNRQDKRYLKYLSRTLDKVRQSLDHFPRYKLFADFLNDNGMFERAFEL